MGVTIIIPTLNEIDGMRAVMPRIRREWYDELIVADGGSTDGTVAYCMANQYPVFIQTGRGLTNAEDEAFDRSTQDIFVFFTPDGNSIPELIPDLVAKIREGYDMVIASRYLGTAKSHDDDVVTAFGNWMFTAMINVLFRARYTDSLVGMRAYSREAILRMRLREQERENGMRRALRMMNSWEVGASVRAAKLNLRVAEIPGDEPKRIGGVRKMSIIRNGTGALLQILYEYLIGRRFMGTNGK